MSHRILLIHDESAAAETLLGRLAAFGHAVTSVASAIQDVEDEVADPDAVFVMMDNASAFDSVSRICREKWFASAVLVATGPTPHPADIPSSTAHRPTVISSSCSEGELYAHIELAVCRTAASRQVQELDDRFFTLSIDMLCLLGFNGYFRRLSPAWERTLGYTRAEMMARPFIEFVHPDDRERTLKQNRGVREGGEALGFENRYQCKDGTYRWFLWNAASDPAAGVIYSLARDITDRKFAEQEREQLVMHLQGALAEVRSLQEILPICSYCRKIRDDADYWQNVEGYIAANTNSRFSHSICPDCYEKEVEPQMDVLPDIGTLPPPAG